MNASNFYTFGIFIVVLILSICWAGFSSLDLFTFFNGPFHSDHSRNDISSFRPQWQVIWTYFFHGGTKFRFGSHVNTLLKENKIYMKLSL